MTDFAVNKITERLYFKDDSWLSMEKSNFQDVYASDMRDLIFSGIINPNERISFSVYCPTVAELVEFLSDHPNFSCFGYVILHDGDYAIAIDGVYCASFNNDDKSHFEVFSMSADVVRENDLFLYCRW